MESVLSPPLRTRPIPGGSPSLSVGGPEICVKRLLKGSMRGKGTSRNEKKTFFNIPTFFFCKTVCIHKPSVNNELPALWSFLYTEPYYCSVWNREDSLLSIPN